MDALCDENEEVKLMEQSNAKPTMGGASNEPN